jgi:hypothetical protein
MEDKNKILLAIAKKLGENSARIIEENAKDLAAMEEYMNYFRMMVKKIHNQGGGMSAHPQEWWLENEVPGSVTQGADIEQFIDDYIAGNILVIRMSDGTVLRIPVENYMGGGYSNDFNTPGEVEISIHCAQGAFSISQYVYVIVQPDLSQLELLGSYAFRDTASMGWGTIFLYTNGIMMANGQSFNYAMMTDDIIEVMYCGAPVVIALDRENMTAACYIPTAPLLGTYTLAQGRDNTLIFAVYGKDINKRAKNMKFTSMFFTASKVFLRHLWQKRPLRVDYE